MNARNLPLRRGLLWWLAGTLVLSALALWWPAAPPPPLVASAETTSPPAGLAGARVVMDSPAPPAALARPDFSTLGRFDPFAGVTAAPAAPAAPPPPPPAAPPAEPAPPAAPAPVPVARLIGRMSDPAGVSHLYLQDGERIVAAQLGGELSDGYTVKSIDKQALTLHHPRLQATVAIPLPPDEAPPDR